MDHPALLRSFPKLPHPSSFALRASEDTLPMKGRDKFIANCHVLAVSQTDGMTIR
jgi:hypothetical protein